MTTFVSDNTAGAHSDVVAAIAEASAGHALPYGADPWTARAHELLRAAFGPEAEPFLVLTGTAANVLAVDQLTRSYHAVICPDTAHLATEQCGAPERFAGVKLLPVPTRAGKLQPGDLAPLLEWLGDEHIAQPRIVSVSQATELGTVYGADELAALVEEAHRHGLLVHLDGARLANAAARLGVSPGTLTADVGVDVVSLGLTKTGGLLAEAVVFLRPELAEGFAFVRKQGMQLASKQRFVAAQVVALLEDDLWLRLASHANAMADRLAARLEGIVELAQPVEANAVFARVPVDGVEALEQAGAYMRWHHGLVRWMTAWDTTADEVDAFASRVEAALA